MYTIKIYNSGDKVYDIWRKKSGTVKYLRNDEREKNCRKTNPTHLYYFIEYDDGSFDTYISGNDLTLFETSTNSEQDYNLAKQMDNIIFNPGLRFMNTLNKKTGTIRYLRNDEYEKKYHQFNPTHYYYHVDYDDGSFETYENGKNLIPI